MRMKLFLAIACIIALMGQANAAVDASTKKYCVEYDKQMVTVTGTVLMRTLKYDKSDWGDVPPEARNPSGVTFPLLILDQRMCTYGADDDEQEFLQWALQFLDVDNCFRREWSGNRVKVTGTVFHGSNWHHQTQILLIAKRMEGLGGKLPPCVETFR